MITLCIATAIPLLREGLLRVLDPERDILPSQLAGDSDAVLRVSRPGRPDVLLLDTDLPGEATMPLLRRLRQRGYAGPVLLFGDWDEESVHNARRLDVQGMLSIFDDGEEFVRAVHAASAGEQRISRRIRALLETPAGHQAALDAIDERLTPTEQQVLLALAAGRTSREIAGDMFISYRTVQKHRNNMARKLGLEGSNALLAFAVRHAGSPS